MGINTCYDEGECGGDDDENNNVGDEVGDEDNVCNLLQDFAGLDCVEAG